MSKVNNREAYSLQSCRIRVGRGCYNPSKCGKIAFSGVGDGPLCLSLPVDLVGRGCFVMCFLSHRGTRSQHWLHKTT